MTRAPDRLFVLPTSDPFNGGPRRGCEAEVEYIRWDVVEAMVAAAVANDRAARAAPLEMTAHMKPDRHHPFDTSFLRPSPTTREADHG